MAEMGFIRRHKNDILLITALLVLALGAWAFTLMARQSGGEAVVTVNGEEAARLPLSRDTALTIGEGEHTNTVAVENGEVLVTEASCPDHICIRQGRISYDGQTIICLPNRLVVTVVGADSGPDAVAG